MTSKIKQKIILIIVTNFLGILTGSFSATASHNSTSMTITKYEAYLNHYSNTTAKNAGISAKYRRSAVAGAKQHLSVFLNLSIAQKK